MMRSKTFVCAASLAAVAAVTAAAAVLQPTFTVTTLGTPGNIVVNSMKLADIDADGHLDIVTTENSSALVIRYMDGYGSVARTASVGALGVPPTGAGIADFNNDGRLDIVVVDSGNIYQDGHVYLLLQQSNGSFVKPAPFATFKGGQDAVVGDVNEDGYPDVVIPSNYGGDRLFFGTGAGIDPTPTIVHASTFNDAYARLADVNGDDHLDLIVNNVDDPSLNYPAGIHVQLGAGDGTFGAPALLPARLLNQSLAAGDLNGDGLDDIVAAGSAFFAGNRHVAVFLSQGGGAFAAPIRLGGASQTNVANVALADLNQDGTLDIISTPGAIGPDTNIYTFLNDGAASFTSGPTLAAAGAYSLAAGVMRSGAAADIFAGRGNATIYQYLNGAGQDVTAPTVYVPPALTVEAEGPSGAHVSFSPTADDDLDGALTPACEPASGSLFPIGSTTVTCTATDAAGNEGSASFAVTVEDTTAPSVTAPADVTAEATGPGGAPVTFGSASATDLVDGSVVPTCAPASGSTFPLGSTTVTCTATDAAGNQGSASFSVTVVDTTAPAFAVMNNITTDATSLAGATVPFAASATDVVDGPVTVTCTPSSGSLFPVGTTSVSCSASDSRGNGATAGFTVTVRGPGGLFDELWLAVQGIGPGRSLSAKIGNARSAYSAGDPAKSCDLLGAFINEVRAQSGKHIAPAVAADLIARATQIRQIIGC